MLSPKFYLLIGAIESAHAFLVRYYRLAHPNLKPSSAPDDYPVYGEGPDPFDHPATGDTHLDPFPGKVSEVIEMLPKIKNALLNAEGDLSFGLYDGRKKDDKSIIKNAWNDFTEAVTNESFRFAKVVRRLMWVAGKPGRVFESTEPGDTGTGAPEWEMMDRRLRRILQAFAEVSLGGGEDNPALNGPGILGSSDESISY